MSGFTTSSAASTDDNDRWAALDEQNERLVDVSHPLLAELLAELRRDYPDIDRSLPAAS
jgi:hypothetical protein